MAELLGNRILRGAALATFVAQLIKVMITLVLERRLALERLPETGGMPSSHSAAVAALATGMGVIYGWGSPYFTLAAVFGSIVIYDATGIRRAVGMQAALINSLVTELAHLFGEGFQPQVLKTLLGHTYPQVFVGAALGVATSAILFL